MKLMPASEIDKHPSRPFKGFDWSDHPNVLTFINCLFYHYELWAKDQCAQRIKNKKEIQTHLMCFTLEAYRTYLMFPDLYMGVSLGNETIPSYKKSRYKPHHFSFTLTNRVIDFLVTYDWFEFLGGVRARPTGAKSQQRSTRVRATEHLIGLIRGHDINQYMISTYPEPAEVIILRKAKSGRQKTGDKVEYEDDDFTKNARSNLNNINQFLDKQFIDIELNDEQEERLNQRLADRQDDGKDKFFSFTDKALKRVFNNSSFKLGGRFYGGFWQQLPKEYRFLITINEKRTIQLDFSGMHFAMLYAQCNALMADNDPYQLEGYSSKLRANIKTSFNIMINCLTAKEATTAIDSRIKSGQFNSDLISGESLLDAFRAKHPVIEKYIASGEGLALQFLDSKIAELIMLKGMEEDVCILPIHDGFIINTSMEKQLHIWMREAFLEVMGTEINVKQDPIYLEILSDALKENETATVEDTDGIQHPLHSYSSDTANSFNVINTADELLTGIINSRNYKLRREEWFKTYKNDSVFLI